MPAKAGEDWRYLSRSRALKQASRLKAAPAGAAKAAVRKGLEIAELIAMN
jgi:hypothetical protein